MFFRVFIWYSACHTQTPSWHDIIADLLSRVVNGAAFGFLDHSVDKPWLPEHWRNACNPEGFLRPPDRSKSLFQIPFFIYLSVLAPRLVLNSYLKWQIDKVCERGAADFASLTGDFSKMPPVVLVNLWPFFRSLLHADFSGSLEVLASLWNLCFAVFSLTGDQVDKSKGMLGCSQNPLVKCLERCTSSCSCNRQVIY